LPTTVPIDALKVTASPSASLQVPQLRALLPEV